MSRTGAGVCVRFTWNEITCHEHSALLMGMVKPASLRNISVGLWLRKFF